jgi:hypothetical protein
MVCIDLRIVPFITNAGSVVSFMASRHFVWRVPVNDPLRASDGRAWLPGNVLQALRRELVWLSVIAETEGPYPAVLCQPGGYGNAGLAPSSVTV